MDELREVTIVPIDPCDHPRFCLTGPIEAWGDGPWIDCLRCEANGPLPVTWAIRGPIAARKNEPAD